jgi:hypothetical protein
MKLRLYKDWIATAVDVKPMDSTTWIPLTLRVRFGQATEDSFVTVRVNGRRGSGTGGSAERRAQ